MWVWITGTHVWLLEKNTVTSEVGSEVEKDDVEEYEVTFTKRPKVTDMAGIKLSGVELRLLRITWKGDMMTLKQEDLHNQIS